MHMIRRKDLNSAELETPKISRSPTTVITVNGEVQTTEVTTVYVKELDFFLTVKLLEDTPAVLSLGKHCEGNGYSYEWASGHKPFLLKEFSDTVQHGEIRANRGPWFIIDVFTTTSSTQDIEGSIPNPASIECESEDRQARCDPLQPESPEWLHEFRENLVKKFLNTETHTRVLLMNHLLSRREKWYWANTIFTLTSRKTGIARSARGLSLQLPRAEDVLVESYLLHKNLMT